MRNLVLCCDGTWNTPDQKDQGILAPTNVCKLHNLVAAKDDNDNEQLKYYRAGVGTEGGTIRKTWEGGTGAGLAEAIKSAYRWVCDHHQADDRLFLFGFSRGAYTVRSLASFLNLCGIPKLPASDDESAWKLVDRAFDIGYVPDGKNWWEGIDVSFKVEPKQVEIHFLGVWDTVGSVGIPDDLAVANFVVDAAEKLMRKIRRRPSFRPFKDSKLGSYVKTARQAMALDEKRASFVANVWDEYDAAKSDVKQLWFPGVHCDVGGGYLQRGLADGALKWMVDEAVACGLAIDEARFQPPGLAENHLDVIHDSFVGVFKALPTYPRNFPAIDQPEYFHSSALTRHEAPPLTEESYKPTIRLGVGEEKTFPVYAAQAWNYTGLYLERGQKYALSASGQWLDASIKCGPAGASDGSRQWGKLLYYVAKPAEVGESLWKKGFKNKHANFFGTRRYQEYDWMALIGAIANGACPKPDGTPDPHEVHSIGDKKTIEVGKSGYFYAFANDAWRFYKNNKGSVQLTIKRIA